MRKVTFILAMLVFASSVMAATYQNFAEDTKKATFAWKKALGTTSANNKAESAKLMKEFMTEWNEIVKKYSSTPPAEYKKVAGYQDNIHVIGLIMGKASAEVEEGKVLEAHDTIEAYRYITWDMRADAGINTLIDKLNDLHEVMELVLEEMEIAEADQLKKIMKRKGTWLRIKWLEARSYMKKQNMPADVMKAVDEGLQAINNLAKYANQQNVDKADEEAHKVKKAFKKMYFNDLVY